MQPRRFAVVGEHPDRSAELLQRRSMMHGSIVEESLSGMSLSKACRAMGMEHPARRLAGRGVVAIREDRRA